MARALRCAPGVSRIAILHSPLTRGWTAFVKLAAVALLIAIGLAASDGARAPVAAVAPGTGDVALYQGIVSDMRAGADYYDAAVGEHRERGYPLRPFVTVRLPTLAWLQAALGSETALRLALAGLALMAAGAWAVRLARAGVSPVQFGIALAALSIGGAAAFAPGGGWLHEVWAGLLIALSLALRTPSRFGAAVLIGLCAALLRELAAPYLLVMALTALMERRYREASAWGAALGVFAIALSAHALNVQALVSATDLASPGWLASGGWEAVLRAAHWSLSLVGLDALTALVLPLALLGLMARPLDKRLMLIAFGYSAGFLLIGRADNSYWGFIVAPLWLLGLAHLGPALKQCWDDVRGVFGVPALLRVA